MKKKRPVKRKKPVEIQSCSPYHPVMLDLNCMSEADADAIERALADAGLHKRK